MPSLASCLLSELVSSLSLHRIVLQALEDDLELRRLATRLYDSRKAVLTIVSHGLRYTFIDWLNQLCALLGSVKHFLAKHPSCLGQMLRLRCPIQQCC